MKIVSKIYNSEASKCEKKRKSAKKCHKTNINIKKYEVKIKIK